MSSEQWALGAFLTVCASLRELLGLIIVISCRSGDGMVDRVTNDHIVIIETFLSKLNRGQGPGFVLFGKVVSKAVLITAASKIAAYGSLVIQALTSLQVDAIHSATVTNDLASELAGQPTGGYNVTGTNTSISTSGS